MISLQGLCHDSLVDTVLRRMPAASGERLRHLSSHHLRQEEVTVLAPGLEEVRFQLGCEEQFQATITSGAGGETPWAYRSSPFSSRFGGINHTIRAGLEHVFSVLVVMHGNGLHSRYMGGVSGHEMFCALGVLMC
jgi:hypothetical protein